MSLDRQTGTAAGFVEAARADTVPAWAAGAEVAAEVGAEAGGAVGAVAVAGAAEEALFAHACWVSATPAATAARIATRTVRCFIPEHSSVGMA
jgi:hypothetical protein